jgi:hypothetical protein
VLELPTATSYFGGSVKGPSASEVVGVNEGCRSRWPGLGSCSGWLVLLLLVPTEEFVVGCIWPACRHGVGRGGLLEPPNSASALSLLMTISASGQPQDGWPRCPRLDPGSEYPGRHVWACVARQFSKVNGNSKLISTVRRRLPVRSSGSGRETRNTI